MSDQAGADSEQSGPGAAGEQADALEQLSTQELHDRAMHRAERHLDVRFFWRLLSEIPVAEAASGDEGEAEYDAQFLKGLLSDALGGKRELLEALRPLYIDYLRAHPDH